MRLTTDSEISRDGPGKSWVWGPFRAGALPKVVDGLSPWGCPEGMSLGGDALSSLEVMRPMTSTIETAAPGDVISDLLHAIDGELSTRSRVVDGLLDLRNTASADGDLELASTRFSLGSRVSPPFPTAGGSTGSKSSATCVEAPWPDRETTRVGTVGPVQPLRFGDARARNAARVRRACRSCRQPEWRRHPRARLCAIGRRPCSSSTSRAQSCSAVLSSRRAAPTAPRRRAGFPTVPRLCPSGRSAAGSTTRAELFAATSPVALSTLANASRYPRLRVVPIDARAHKVVEQLAQRIHDHAIDDALRNSWPRNERASTRRRDHGRPRHALATSRVRDVVDWRERSRSAGLVCASGGGPGAMEATNLGAGGTASR